MNKVKAIVLRAAGINCDQETVEALELAGAQAARLHINSIIKDPSALDDAQILVFPGGFSYGDDVAAGKILANQVMHHLGDAVRGFIDAGKLVIGICNGFQVLVKTGILPGFSESDGSSSVTITYNDSAKFEDRWVYLEPAADNCVFITPGRRLYLPIAHGEGKVVTKTPESLDKLLEEGHAAFRYVDSAGGQGGFPVNPNGSMESIAALTDTTGRVLGLMPHPERFIRRTQHPFWTRMPENMEADGMTIFNNAVEYVSTNF
ncbi:Phosphoribosylformylglycinamidine synthase [Limihaloglobus sulfuriphilus]|uniref:Phosphoribosylformylglycinamidine synthase n=1 Tax=Limihaloglobus sulfuriphilus TaxID=1851148 RepID=A0A1Q2MDV3_9BACT|nr:phosphoribosylformylglycinamidine synthase I [Limihaloglobus sulfuriphilus]AQQ70881.1 Phosphoribosylformylglycinamidine synthase [Limihaloglobus sulfuriphilus]